MTDGNHALEVTSSRIVYENKWMTLREDEIVRSSGARGIYGVVEKPPFAVIVPIDAEGNLHLVEQYRHPIGRRSLEVPQGSWERADVAVEVLAQAELREETGLIAGTLEMIGRLHLAPGFCTQTYDVFLATDLTPGPTSLDPEEEGLMVVSVAFSDVFRLIADGTITDATTVAAIALCTQEVATPQCMASAVT